MRLACSDKKRQSRIGPAFALLKSTHSTPGSEARGRIRVDTEQRFLPRLKNRGLAPSNVSNMNFS
jgi:hypothetical protein